MKGGYQIYDIHVSEMHMKYLFPIQKHELMSRFFD